MISAASAQRVAPLTAAKTARPATSLDPVAGPLTLADMEAEILKAAPATDEDLRVLMKKRSQAVEAYLLKTEKITAERLFIVIPKTTALPAKGESRVVLSLN